LLILAVNLAIGISSLNKKVALLDADIYGPSIPTLMNLQNMKPEVSERKFLIPLENYGIKCMSMGFMVDKEAPVVWRGLMVCKDYIGDSIHLLKKLVLLTLL
jgi:ATP-binding protein involved in chromosome partitioning